MNETIFSRSRLLNLIALLVIITALPVNSLTGFSKRPDVCLKPDTINGLLVEFTSAPDYANCTGVSFSPTPIRPFALQLRNKRDSVVSCWMTAEFMTVPGSFQTYNDQNSLCRFADSMSLGSFQVASDDSVDFTVPVPSNLSPGMYELKIKCSLNNGDNIVFSMHTFSILNLTSDQEITQLVNAAKPMSGGTIPDSVGDIIGAHLLEWDSLAPGLQALQTLGFGTVKLWFPTEPNGATLVNIIQTRVFTYALSEPFKTYVLQITSILANSKPWLLGTSDTNYFNEVRQEFYELTKYLLQTYRDRDVTFILDFWEGDWLVRNTFASDWPTNFSAACTSMEGMIKWVQMRQEGVDEARSQFGSQSKVKVYNAVEVNRTWDALVGIPTVTTYVLPYVKVDMVGYSSYDGFYQMPISLWRAIQMIQNYSQPSPYFGKHDVYLAEIGYGETGLNPNQISDWWDNALGVVLSTDVKYMLVWETYDTIDMTGMWLVDSQDNFSVTADYLHDVIKHAGGTLTVLKMQVGSGVPNSFCLHQNYPNPFNPTTAIKYDLPAHSFVTLKVYDILGREMKTLINQQQNAGSYTVNLDADRLPSGVYFYRITTRDFATTKKLVVVK